MIPFRILAYLDDESSATWWITTNKRTFERVSGDRINVGIERLIAEAHGFNDPEAVRLFKKSQQARFHPARGIDGT